MEKRLITLKLVLDSIDVEPNISTIDDRKKIQKAVYLSQLTGVDLGYRFGWYLMGPYCPSLTSDYYALKESIESKDDEHKKFELKKSIKIPLEKIKPLFEVPKNVDLSVESWLELIASYHFLRSISDLSVEETKKTLKEKKSELFPYIKEAEKALKKHSLI